MVFVLALGCSIYPIWLEALKQLSIPLSVVLGGYFGNDMVKNNNKNKINN